MNNSIKSSEYKKPTFFSRIARWFDKLLGIKDEDYLSDEESESVMKNFDKAWRMRFRGKRKH